MDGKVADIGLGKEETSQGPRTLSTLLVPYTVGGKLRARVQLAEDQFVALTGGGRVCVVEQGGDVLANMLCCNDPWAGKVSCNDDDCTTCKSRAWLKAEAKAAKKRGGLTPRGPAPKVLPHVPKGGGQLLPPVP